MMGHTHIIIGGLSGAAYATAINAPPSTLALCVLGAAFAALVPDIDHPQSEVRQRMGIFGLLFAWLPHRGITHSLLALVSIGAAVFVISRSNIHPLALPLAWSFMAGYASHLVADAATRAGIPFFMPLNNTRITLLPKLLTIKTGGIVENVIASLCLYLLLRLGGVTL